MKPKITCLVCGSHPAQYEEISVYAARKGGDMTYTVCALCYNADAGAAFATVERVNRAADAVAGYRVKPLA